MKALTLALTSALTLTTTTTYATTTTATTTTTNIDNDDNNGQVKNAKLCFIRLLTHKQNKTEFNLYII